MATIAAPWLWIAGGILLCVTEAFLPGAFLLWVGLAAIATGLAAFLLPLGPVGQLLMFSVLGLGAVALGFYVGRREKREKTDAPYLHDRAGALIGQSFILESAIVNGSGSIRVADTVWRVTGEDMPAGTRVKVVGVQGATLTVTRA